MEGSRFDPASGISVYGLKLSLDNPFASNYIDSLKPGKIGISFLGSQPTIKFTKFDRVFESSLAYSTTVKYFVVVSWDRQLVQYYTNCNKVRLETIYESRRGLEKDLQVIEVQESSFVDKEGRATNQIEISPQTLPGKVYYAAVYAQVNIEDDIEQEFGTYKPNERKIMYGTVRFETSEFGASIELLTAFIGLIAIAIISCMLLQGTCVK